MNEQAFMTACYMLGSRYHSGQWSKGYRLLCQASERARVNHSGWDIGRTVEQLGGHALYAQHSDFRNAVACMLNRLKHQRYGL